MEPIVSALHTVLIVLFHMTGSYGWSILLLTGGLRLALLPLALWQQRATRASASVQAEVKQIQQAYKGAEAERRVRELYSRSGGRLLLGCLPALAQWPVFVAVYSALVTFPFTIPTGFFWVQNLALPDPYFILPLVSVALSAAQIWTTSPREHRLAMVFLPLLMGFFVARASAAVALYWVASNLFSLVQQLFLARRPAIA